MNTGLVSTTSTTFKMGADDTTVLDPNGDYQRALNLNIPITFKLGPGRNSVRIRSIESYTTHVAIFDVEHMPQVSYIGRGWMIILLINTRTGMWHLARNLGD
jgi:hypothetical protein